MLQDRMSDAVSNYLALVLILREDLTTLYEMPLESSLSQRNFIRSAIALLEGSCHCYLDLCAVALEREDVTVSRAEETLILCRRTKSTTDRIKLAIRLVHRIFHTGHQPDFSGDNWVNAQEAIDKRHRLMHPMTPQDLELSHTAWKRILAGIRWLQREEFLFVEFLNGIRE
jgi:hypothetical protein